MVESGPRPYDDASNRCSMLLVETSNAKAGPPSLFGSEDKLFDMGPGHVTRNIRLALVAIDIVEPYAAWRDATEEGCVHRASSTDLKFSVGGAARVESSTTTGAATTPTRNQYAALLKSCWRAPIKRRMMRRPRRRAGATPTPPTRSGRTSGPSETRGLRRRGGSSKVRRR